MPDSSEALVLSTNRRWVTLCTPDNRTIQGKLSSKSLDVTIGDKVSYSSKGDEAFVEGLVQRKNCLTRSYRDSSRDLAANLDRLLVICAVAPLFNSTFVDRITTAALASDIPVTLIVNKIDLGVENTVEQIELYEAIGFSVLKISAKKGDSFNELIKLLENPELKAVALAGVSGVGKTTILNKLIPNIEKRTGDVSRTGQGKQTTTQPEGFLYGRRGSKSLLMIDLPGVQQFGVSHLSNEGVRSGFPEFLKLQEQCEFSNCLHRNETRCQVKAALDDGLIANSRYQSYISMLDEVAAARAY